MKSRRPKNLHAISLCQSEPVNKESSSSNTESTTAAARCLQLQESPLGMEATELMEEDSKQLPCWQLSKGLDQAMPPHYQTIRGRKRDKPAAISTSSADKRSLKASAKMLFHEACKFPANSHTACPKSASPAPGHTGIDDLLQEASA